MEDDHSDPQTTKRVRILSTLDAPRAAFRRTRPVPGQGAPAPTTRRWAWSLWALLGAGALCSVGGLWLASQDDERTDARPTRLAQTASSVPRPALHVPPASSPASASALAIGPATETAAATTPLAALIDNTPTAASAAGHDDGPLALLTNSPSPAASAPTPTKPAARPATARRKGKSDDDVALLEAMFAHAGPRKAPISASEELAQRCGPLSGAEARACRVKVCKRHPDARICR
jgi:hypothetical protein